MKKKWKFALLGSGTAAHFHARSLRLLEAAQLRGVFSDAPEQCGEFAAAYGISVYSSADKLLADPEIDAVCICVPSGLHADWAVSVLNSGKHAVVEKPLALTVEDCIRVGVAEKRSGRTCAVISQSRFSRVNRSVRRALEAEACGKIATASLIMNYYRSPEYYQQSPWRGTWAMDGGVLMNQGIHGVDLLSYFLGKADAVTAMTQNRLHQIEAPDTAAAVVQFQSGALGMIQVTTSAAPGFESRIELCGTKGSILLEGDRILRWDAPREFLERREPEQVLQNGHTAPEDISIEGHRLQLLDFIEAVETGRPVCCGTKEAAETTALICVAYESSRTGRKIRLP